MGRAGALRKCLAEWKGQIKDDDQEFWTMMYLEQHARKLPTIKLDHFAQLFCCVVGCESTLKYNNKKWTCTKTNSNPCILHFNGHSKRILVKCWNEMNGTQSWIPLGIFVIFVIFVILVIYVLVARRIADRM